MKLVLVILVFWSVFVQTQLILQQQILVEIAGSAGDDLGSATAISSSGTSVFVGTPGATVSGIQQGAIYMYTQNSSNYWNQQQTLASSDGMAGDSFGLSVSISGNTIVIGAPYATINGSTEQGAAYVFVQNSSNYWNQQQKLVSSDGMALDKFGYSVSVSGNTIVIGALDATINSNSNQGASYVFVQNSSGYWIQQQKLVSNDGMTGDYFGWSVSVSGNTIFIGAPYATINGTYHQGACYVFTQSGSTWNQQQKLVSSDGNASYHFGNSISISGNTIVIGAYGATINGSAGQGVAYVFTQSGSTWNQYQELIASDGSTAAYFGWSVSISGTTIVIGAYGASVNGNAQQGASYVFIQNGSNYWIQQQKLISSDGKTTDYFGYSVSVLSGSTGIIYLVGAPFHTVSGKVNEGEAYIFFQQTAQQQVTTQQQTTEVATTQQQQQQTTEHNSPTSDGLILCSFFQFLITILIACFI